MRIVAIGTPTCWKCKQIIPKIEEYCKNNNFEYEYVSLDKADKDIYDILNTNDVRQAPAFIIYENENIRVTSGDSILSELIN